MKKLIFLLVALLPLLAAASVRGDVDGTGGIDGNDLNVLINILLGKDAASNYDGRADVNNDTYVDGNDLNTLINILLGEEVPPPTHPEPVTETFTVKGMSFTMIAVEGGTFIMGSQTYDSTTGNYPAHQVTVSSYSIGQTEVTQELWVAVMGSNPSWFNGYGNPNVGPVHSSKYYETNLQRPVEMVSWDDCQEFITKLNQMTGRSFRLPTEAEWEYAARGGNMSQGYKYSGSNIIGDVAWYAANAYYVGERSPDYGTHTVATKAVNELGLYDMSGNVCEWCQDWYGYYSSEAQTNPTGPASGYSRVIRDGCWLDDAWYCGVTRRYDGETFERMWHIGLRLAL